MSEQLPRNNNVEAGGEHSDTHEQAERHAERLRERVYVSFTALAVLLALSAHAHEVDAGEAAITLFVTVLGVLLAGFGAELIGYAVAHEKVPDRHEIVHMVQVGFGALLAVAVPLLLIGLSGLGVMKLAAALKAGQIVLIVTLGVLTFIALRRVRLPLWERLAFSFLMIAVAALAVGLELFAHML